MTNRKSRWKTALQALIFLIVALVTLVAISLSLLSWQGRRHWAETQKELLAKGEKLTLVELAPPPIPDDQNFFADPIWSELTDRIPKTDDSGKTTEVPRIAAGKRQLDVLSAPLTEPEKQDISSRFPNVPSGNDRLSIARQIWKEANESKDPDKTRTAATTVLALLQPTAPMLDRLAVLGERPGSRFPIEYAKGFRASLEHISYLMKAGQILSLRAECNLALGDAGSARRDVLLIFRLAESPRDEPTLISLLVRISIAMMAAGNIDRGIVAHQWTAEDLEAFEAPLEKLHFDRDLARALRGERGGFNQIVAALQGKDRVKSVTLITSMQGMQDGPGGAPNQLSSFALSAILWFYANLLPEDQAFANRLFQQMIENVEKGNIAPESNFNLEALKFQGNPWNDWRHVLSRVTLPALGATNQRIAITQTQIAQTRIACALELYRLKNGQYPETVAALVPDFIAKLPDDPITGKPMNYRLVSPQEFKLWSVGWDLRDEGGTPGEFKNEGDIVWGIPLPKKSRPIQP